MWANLDGSEPQILVSTGLNATDGLAWDWLNEKLYWTDTNRKIEVYDIGSGYRRTLIETGLESIPRGVVLDPDRRYMYWTDWGQPAKIERASMDGTARETLHSTSLIWPNDITIDRQTQTLYWIDASLDKIESSLVTGANRRVLTRDLILHPFSISFYGGVLYWSDWGFQRVILASVGNLENKLGLVPVLPNDPTGVKVVALDAQPITSSNPCSAGNGGCSHLCLLAITAGHSCNCPQGLELANDGTTCEGGGGTTTPTTLPPPPPRIVNLTITSSPIDSEYFTGLQLTLTCSIYIQPQPSSPFFSVSAHWTKSGSALTSSDRLTVGEGLVRVGPSVYQTSLAFSSLDGIRGDEGNYTCSASIALAGSSISTASTSSIVEIPTMFFQIRLSGVTDCLTWRSSATSAKDIDLMTAILTNVAPRCGCDFTEDRITNRVFQCFPTSPRTVTYHALLHGTPQANVAQLLTILQDWATSSATTIAVQFLPLSVESFCSLDSDSPLEQCQSDPPISPTTVTTSGITLGATSNNQLDITAITVPIVVVVSVLVCVLLVTAVVVGVVLRSRHSSQDLHSNQEPASTETTKQNALAVDLEQNHEYEEIGKYHRIGRHSKTVPESSTLEFSVSQCPAYTCTPKSLVHPELQYEEVNAPPVQSRWAVSHAVPQYEVPIVRPDQSQWSVDANHRDATSGEDRPVAWAAAYATVGSEDTA